MSEKKQMWVVENGYYPNIIVLVSVSKEYVGINRLSAVVVNLLVDLPFRAYFSLPRFISPDISQRAVSLSRKTHTNENIN